MRLDSDAKTARLKRIRSLSHMLDNSITIPGTRYRFGLDPILGLLPGGGDLASFLFSAYIIWEGAQLGVSQEVLTRMVSNVLFDTVAGTVPVFGDLVDVTWKANTKNVTLLEDHLKVTPHNSRSVNRWVVVGMLLGLLIVFSGVVMLSFFIFSWLFRQLAGG
jgi:hypothetical protein